MSPSGRISNPPPSATGKNMIQWTNGKLSIWRDSAPAYRKLTGAPPYYYSPTTLPFHQESLNARVYVPCVPSTACMNLLGLDHVPILDINTTVPQGNRSLRHLPVSISMIIITLLLFPTMVTLRYIIPLEQKLSK